MSNEQTHPLHTTDKKIIDSLIVKENPEDYISFIVFEPASLRIPDNDLLLIGDQVTHLFDNVMTSDKFENNIHWLYNKKYKTI